MSSGTPSPSLRQLFLRLILSRVFVPLVAVGLTVTVGAGYLSQQNLLNQQAQVANTVAQIVGHHIAHGERILDAVARLAELENPDKLRIFMDSTWKAYGYFETLYSLDRDNRISLIIPSGLGYSGLDMSNLPDFKQNRERQEFRISRPFISLRTGEPTVHLVRSLAQGGAVVGELNLGIFQKEIDRISQSTSQDFVFITDQHGTLLAHPDAKLVKQQTNLNNLEIIAQAMRGQASANYDYHGERMIGSASREPLTGWIVVDQTRLKSFLGSYALAFLLIFAVSLLVWIVLALSLRKQIQRFVVTPMERLSDSANALAQGDYTQVSTLSVTPTSFAELHKLSSDFQTMSGTLQIRESELQRAHDELEARVAARTEELSISNKELKITSDNLQQSNLELQKEIAERKRVEAQLAQNLVEIEAAHKKLKEAQSQILQQEKLASIGQLAAGVAHEINNPIGFVNSNLGTLRTYVADLLRLIEAYTDGLRSLPEDLSPEIAQFDEKIGRLKREIDYDYLLSDIESLIAESINGAGRVKRIVQDLRDFSRTGNSEWLMADLNEGLNSTLNILANEFKDKATIIRDYGKLPQVECIPSQINQVFMNVLINASQAISQHGQIIIRSGSSSQEVWISISDDGKGIDSADIDRIFDPFFTTKEIGTGTGLGLSVSLGIVRNHGGRIEVQSQLGQGSTFTIHLPIHHLAHNE